MCEYHFDVPAEQKQDNIPYQRYRYYRKLQQFDYKLIVGFLNSIFPSMITFLGHNRCFLCIVWTWRPAILPFQKIYSLEQNHHQNKNNKMSKIHDPKSASLLYHRSQEICLDHIEKEGEIMYSRKTRGTTTIKDLEDKKEKRCIRTPILKLKRLSQKDIDDQKCNISRLYKQKCSWSRSNPMDISLVFQPKYSRNFEDLDQTKKSDEPFENITIKSELVIPEENPDETNKYDEPFENITIKNELVIPEANLVKEIKFGSNETNKSDELFENITIKTELMISEEKLIDESKLDPLKTDTNDFVRVKVENIDDENQLSDPLNFVEIKMDDKIEQDNKETIIECSKSQKPHKIFTKVEVLLKTNSHLTTDNKSVVSVDLSSTIYYCELCLTKTPGFTPCNLKYHIRRLHKDVIQNYECDVCEKALWLSADLTLPERNLHNGIKSQKCTLCLKASEYLSHLSSHEIQICTTCSKPLDDSHKVNNCTECLYSSCSKTNLERHFRQIHISTYESGVPCDLCKHKIVLCKSAAALHNHKRKVHLIDNDSAQIVASKVKEFKAYKKYVINPSDSKYIYLAQAECNRKKPLVLNPFRSTK